MPLENDDKSRIRNPMRVESNAIRKKVEEIVVELENMTDGTAVLDVDSITAATVLASAIKLLGKDVSWDAQDTAGVGYRRLRVPNNIV